MKRFVLMAALLAGGPGVARACTLCIGFPEKTVTDYLIEADCVVLARPAVSNPFTYEPATVLQGAYDGGEIGLLVDTRTRRLLAAEPQRRVVLVQNERGGAWRSLGIASDDYLTVLRRIIVIGYDWKGEEGAQRRWRFFYPLFGRDDPSLRQLAYLEMSRAPYPAIRELGRVASREAYLPLLDDPKYLEWRTLAILLLAQSENPDDQQAVRDAFESAKRLRMTRCLAAWAAALIEVDGLTAIDAIEDAYLNTPGRSPEELEAVLQAWSMIGSINEGPLRKRILAAYRRLLAGHSEFAPRIKSDLEAWGRANGSRTRTLADRS